MKKNTNRPEISIIVPIFNSEKFLIRCIESIRGQIFTDIEIILVDDGSKDLSGQICDEYAKKDDRITVIHKENEGLVSARKAGLIISQGKYIGFVDSDDWVEQDMFGFLYNEAISTRADVIADGMIEDMEGYCINRTNALMAGIYSRKKERNYIYLNMLSCEKYYRMGILPYLWNKLIRRELAIRHMMTVDENIRVGEDAAAVYPILILADRIVITNRFHYHYCIRNSSMVRSQCEEEDEYKGVIRLHRFLKGAFFDKGVLPIMEEQLESYSINNVLVRTFGRLARHFEDKMLFPFSGIKRGDSIIIYGAGALGRAVYNYICQHNELELIDWIDRDAQFYRKIGMQVNNIESLHHEDNVKVIISVMSEIAMREIKEGLLRKGFSTDQIVWLMISKEERDLIISDMEMIKV